MAHKTGRLTAYDGACRNIPRDQAEQRIAAGEPHTIRLRVPRDGVTVIRDEVYGAVEFENAAIDDQVLLKSTGFPTWHLLPLCR